MKKNKTEKSFSPIGCAINDKSKRFMTIGHLSDCVTTTVSQLLCHNHCVTTVCRYTVKAHCVSDHCVTAHCARAHCVRTLCVTAHFVTTLFTMKMWHFSKLETDDRQKNMGLWGCTAEVQPKNLTLLKITNFVLPYLLTSKKDFFLTKIKNRQHEPLFIGDSWFLRSKQVKHIFLRIYISRPLCTFSNQPHVTTNILSSLDHLDTIKVEEICKTRFQLFLSCSDSLGDTFIWLNSCTSCN